mgnify:CR=1 FL=1
MSSLVSIPKGFPSEDEGALGFKVRYSGEDPRRSVFESVVKENMVLLEMRRHHVSLEDTFRKLTSND